MQSLAEHKHQQFVGRCLDANLNHYDVNLTLWLTANAS